MTTDFSASPIAEKPTRLTALFEIALLVAIFFVQAGSAVPDVNEAHYLSKAKHYWNPQWCANDFFCNSADAHQVFYWTCGWLTLWFSLPVVAWIGRVVTWILLAWSWRRLSVAMIPHPLYSILSGAAMVALTANFHMAGEWIVGGFEAKGFAFTLLFLGLEQLVRGKWNHAWLLLGAAGAFHVLIGGWAVVAAGIAWLLQGSSRPSLRSMLPALLGGALLALPGLLPALALTRGVPNDVVNQANAIYVYERLGHHLALQWFPPLFVARYIALTLVFSLLSFIAPRTPESRLLCRFVWGALFIALCGAIVSWLSPYYPELSAKLLRYYWFRLADAMVPVAVALLATAKISQLRSEESQFGDASLAIAILLVGVHLGLVLNQRRESPSANAERSLNDAAAWRETCRWINDNTPADAVFLTPRLAHTFRWHANRAEVTNRKDIPQDAQGIVEWWRRQLELHYDYNYGFWRRSLSDIDPEQLRKWGQEYGAKYLVTTDDRPVRLPAVAAPARGYAIYSLEPPAPEKQNSRP